MGNSIGGNMILILIFVLIVVILLGIGICLKVKSYWNDWEGWICWGIGFLVVVIIISTIAIHHNSFKDMYTEQMRYEYNSLTHQLSNDYYNRLTYDGRKQLMDDILNYNQKILSGRAKHNNVWIGAFYPEDYNSLSLINLEDYN